MNLQVSDAERLSAFLDGEPDAAECEAIAERLANDEALRQEYFSSHSGATAEDFHEYYMTEYRDTLFEKYDVVLVPQK